jgi:general secretion pathway protein G
MIELLIVVAIIGILVGFGLPLYTTQIYRANVAKAITDIYTMQRSITNYLTDWGEFPDSLEDVEWDHLTDPWGNKYQYVKIDSEEEEENGGKGKGKGKGKGGGGNGETRVNESQALNSDFDLYSIGKDGKSEPSITAEESQDDVVRANNGSYIGKASDY